MGRKNKKGRYHHRYISQSTKEKIPLSKNIKHSIDKDCEWWADYDSRGNLIHKKISYKLPLIKGRIVEIWIEYNEMGNETHFVRNDGFEYWCQYNKNGNIIHYWDTTGYSEKFTYYKERFVYKETSLGDKTRYTYDKNKDIPISLNYFN